STCPGRLLAAGGRQLPPPAEWWLPATGPRDPVPAAAAAKLRAEPGGQQLLLNDEMADQLLADPLSAAPQSALAAIALVSTVLAAIGFAAASAASARERAGEFTVLLALGAPRRWLVRTVAAEQGVLVGLASLVGLGLGTLTVHLVVPLVVLTPAARRPEPEVLVGLRPGRPDRGRDHRRRPGVGPPDRPPPSRRGRPAAARGGDVTSPAATSTPPRPTGTAPRDEHRPAPWIRTRLRTAPLAALLALALALGTVFLAAAFPRAVDRGTDTALHEYLRARGPVWTSVLATAHRRYGASDLDHVAEKLLSRPNETFQFAADGMVYGARGDRSRQLYNPGLATPDEALPVAGLLYLHGFAYHARLVAGHWPGSGDPSGPVPVALSRSAADTIGIHLGDVLDGGYSPAAGEQPKDSQRAEVVGLYDPNDPKDPFWADLPCPEKACLDGGNPRFYWKTSGMIDAGAVDRLASWGNGATDFWRLPVDLDGLRADRLPRTSEEISSYLAGRTSVQMKTRTGRDDLIMTSPLPQLFQQATARRDAAAPLAAIGPAGLAGVAAVVLCLAAALTFDRRGGEL
ncbi:FtsX-like permease family protein, partial [Streptomyces sp. CB01881]